MYYEATGGTTGEQVRHEYQISTSSQFNCIEFAYHMYGVNMGRLQVFATPGPLQFTVSGNQGDSWKKVRLQAENPFYQISKEVKVRNYVFLYYNFSTMIYEMDLPRVLVI